MILTHFKELYLHMEWADARIWQSIFASKLGVDDDYVLDTLMHIHETQHSFLNVWLERPFVRWKRAEIGSKKELCSWAQSFYPSAFNYLESLTDVDLQTATVLPWAKYFARSIDHQPVETILQETLHQVVSHSMHHRGQVARRLRELEEVPHLTDYIVWVWEDRPQPNWPS